MASGVSTVIVDTDIEHEDEARLDLPEKIESEGHSETARRHLDDEGAYELIPEIAKMRSILPEVVLRTEEEIVLNVVATYE